MELRIFLLSDIHYGKKTLGYNDAIAAHKTKTYLSKMEDGDCLVMLGDMVDGTCIFKTQAGEQTIQSVEQQCQELASIVGSTLQGKEISIFGVIGNHGRSLSNDETDNWDTVFYRYLEDETSKKILSSFREEYIIRNLQLPNGKNVLITHGSDFSMSNGIVPWFAIINRVTRWKSIFTNTNLYAFGHFHSSGVLEVGNLYIVANGSFVSSDAWALRKFGYVSNGSQVILNVEEETSVDSEFFRPV